MPEGTSQSWLTMRFLANQVRQQMLDDKDAQYIVDVTAPTSSAQRDEWQRQVRAKAIDGVLTIDSSDPQNITATFTSLSAAEVTPHGSLQSALNRGVVNERLIGKGMTQAEVDSMLARVSIEALQLDKNGKIGKSNGKETVIKATLMLSCSRFPSCSTGSTWPGRSSKRRPRASSR